jgi:hypothetical protein
MAAKSKYSISSNRVAHCYRITKAHACNLLKKHGAETLSDADDFWSALIASSPTSQLRRRLSDPDERGKVNLRFRALERIEKLQAEIRILKSI